MVDLTDELATLPTGSHCVSLHTTQDEAADHAASFLAGTPSEQAASYWVPTGGLLPLYRSKVGARRPDRVTSVRVLVGPQVERVEGKLRPVEQVLEFVGRHPEGVTAGAETISWYWTADDIRDHLEYEEWFQSLPRGRSRFLCPYDLRRVPAADAPEILAELGAQHTHVALSPSNDDIVQMLQVFVFGTFDRVPRQFEEAVAWAVESGFVTVRDADGAMSLTRSGVAAVSDWSNHD
jgi:hypothetical protein